MAKILVVDDMVENAHLLAHVLTLKGHDTIVAYDGSTAITLFEERKPDLVILDYMMPELDGGQVLARMRASGSGAEVPVIFLTAVSLRQVTQALGEQKAVRLMEKPIDIKLLAKHVGELLPAANGHRL